MRRGDHMLRYNAIYVVILICVLLTSSINALEDSFPILEGPYLGQKPPGTTPEVFAPGIISVKENIEHSAAIFSPDGKEVFWCTNIYYYTDRRKADNLRLYTMKMVDGKWTAPEIASFAKDIRIERPTFSPDGNRLYFESLSNPDNMDNLDIFVVEREGEGWSKPAPLSSIINTPAIERIHCLTPDGYFYFSRNPFTRHEEIFVSKWLDGGFTEPEKLGKDYNSDDYEGVIILSPKEDYMLIGQIDTQHSSPVLNICYKQADGSWSNRIKTPYHCGGFLALSPDGKYLFILDEDIYWVSTYFVEDLRPK
jgi:Tol biopolymer transport system component